MLCCAYEIRVFLHRRVQVVAFVQKPMHRNMVSEKLCIKNSYFLHRGLFRFFCAESQGYWRWE